MDTQSVLYEAGDREVRSLGVEVPRWIDREISCATVAGILQGGCDSGEYMPAVTYHQAVATMADHDESILDYLSDAGFDGSVVPDVFEVGWFQLACWFVSRAVELWAATVEDELARILSEGDNGEDSRPADGAGDLLLARIIKGEGGSHG